MTVLGGDGGKARVAAIALLTSPGLPFVCYGKEIGMSGAKPDERIRTPMQWTGEPGAGFTTGSPWQAPQSDFPMVNVAAQDGDLNSLLNLYRTLIRLHTGRPALGKGDFTALDATGGAAAFLRRSGDDAVLVVINFSAGPLSGVTLSTTRSGLDPGVYTLDLLFGSGDLPPLTVGADGSISAYALPEIPPQSAVIVGLGR